MFLALIISLYSSAQYDRATSAIHKLLEENPVVGVSVAVVKDGRVAYERSFGYKDLETKELLTNQSLFRIASVSKSFTVTSLMQLVEQGKLRLKDDVSDLIGFEVRNPQFPNQKITLEMLLSHTSGLSDREGYFTLDVIDPSKNANWKNCYNAYEPGKEYEYCNLNFNIAGAILERYSGERFDEYVAAHVLKPLGIEGGYNVNVLDSAMFAKIYEYDTNSGEFIESPAAYAPRTKEIENYVRGYSTPIFSPTGGLKISASGLTQYMRMHMNRGELEGKRIISARSERTMRKPRSKSGYALGLMNVTDIIDGQKLIGHTGVAYGLYSAVFFEPKQQYGIVVITNGCHPAQSGEHNAMIVRLINTLYAHVVRNSGD